MKRLLLGVAAFLAVAPLHAFPIIGYVQITTGAVQAGGFNTQTGTVGTFTDTGLSANQCVQTGVGGLLTTTGATCGSGSGGASNLEVLAGVARSSPTATVGFPTSQFNGSVTGSSMTVTLNSSSVTLQGNTNVPLLNAQNVFTGSFNRFNTVNVTSGSIMGITGIGGVGSATFQVLNPISLPELQITASGGVGIGRSNPFGGTPGFTVGTGASNTPGSFGLISSSADATATYSGFIGTYPVDQSVLWMLPKKDGLANQPFVTDGATHLSFLSLTPNQCVQSDANGALTTTGSSCGSAGGGGSSSLGIFRDGIQVTSPTAQVNIFGNDFLAASHGTTAYILLNPATTDFIHNGTAAQTAEFNVTRGTLGGTTTGGFDGQLTINSTQNAGTAEAIYLGPSATGLSISTGTNTAFTAFTSSNSSDTLRITLLASHGGVSVEGLPSSASIPTFTPLSLVSENSLGPTVSVVLRSTGIAISSDTYITGFESIISSGQTPAITVLDRGSPGGGTQNKKGYVTIGDDTVGNPISAKLVIVDSTTDNQAGAGQIEVWIDNPNNNDPVYFEHRVSNNSAPDFRVDAPAPNFEMVNTSTDNTHGYGKWEPFASAYQTIDMQCGSNRAYDNSTFENLCSMKPLNQKDNPPGQYLHAQDLTNDSGVLASSDTSVTAYFTQNSHFVWWTGPLNTTTSYGYAMPDTAASTGDLWYNSGTRGNNFNTRQLKNTGADFRFSPTTGVSISTLTVSSFTLAGVGDGGIIFTIAGSTYGVISSSFQIPSGHILLSGSTNFTAIDGGVPSAGGGGGGGSPVALATGTYGGTYANPVTSTPTLVFVADQSQFGVLAVGTTGYFSLRRAISSVTANFTLASTSTVVLADASAGSLTVTLPTAVGITGKVYTIKRTSSGANTVTVATTSSQTIDGALTQVFSAQYTSIDVISDGSNWSIL